MNTELLKALALLVPSGLLLSYSLALRKRAIPWSTLQIFGALCLIVVVLTHFCEALRVFPWMGWGAKHSLGHYVDFTSAVLGLTLFPAGYVARFIASRTIHGEPR